MKEHSQEQKIISDVSRITREHELLEYLRNNVPYEDLLDETFVAKLAAVNSKAKMALEMAKIYKEEEQAKEKIQQIDSDSYDELDNLINSIGLDLVVPKYRDKIIELAKHHEEEGDYERAQQYYDAIVKNGPSKMEKFIQKYDYDQTDTLYYKAKIGVLACKANMGQELTEEETEELNSSIKTVSSQEKSVDAFLSYFSVIPRAQMLDGDFEAAIKRGIKTGRRKRRRNSGTVKESRQYIPELAPEKRIEYITQNYNVSRAYTGMGEYAGYIAFDIEDKNVLVVEKFYEPLRAGETEPQQSYSAATYILNKQVELDIEKMSKGQLVAMKKSGEKGVDKANHSSKKYYYYLAERVDEVGKAFEINEQVVDNEQVEQELIMPEEQEKVAIENKAEQEIQEPSDIQQITEDNQMEEREEREEEPTTRVEQSVSQTERNLDTILNEMQLLDEEYDVVQNKLQEAKDLQKQVKEMQEKVSKIKTDIASATAGTMTKEIAATIKEQISILGSLKAKLKELEVIEQTIDVEEFEKQLKENREKREKLSEELMNIVGE